MKLLIPLMVILELSVALTACKKEDRVENLPLNKPPIANAGEDISVDIETDSIYLDGSASADSTGSIVSYKWRMISGPEKFTIVNTNAMKTIAKNYEKGIYKFELKVVDNGGLSALDTMQLSVNTVNIPPTVTIGNDTTILAALNACPPYHNVISLSVNNSNDPDGEIVSYLWEGPGIINTPNAPTTTVTGLATGINTFILTLTDNNGATDSDTLSIMMEMNRPLPLVTATLIPVGSFSKPRNYTYAASAGNKIVFANDEANTGNPAFVDIYDLNTGTTTTAQLSAPRIQMGLTAIGNKIYVAGGLVPVQLNQSWVFDGTVSKVVDIYDVTTNTWTSTEMNIAQAAAAITFGNKAIFAGGNYFWPADVINVYDQLTNTWTNATLSQSRQIHSLTKIGNKVFLAGGEYQNDGITTNIDIYDASTNTMSVQQFSAPYHTGWAPSGIAVGNKNYWAGGLFYTPQTYINATDHVEIRDDVTQSSTFACLFQPNTNFKIVLKGNKIIFFTGDGLAKNKFDIYDTSNDTWSIGVLPVEVYDAAIISVNNQVYVAGGFVNNTLSDKIYKLEF